MSSVSSSPSSSAAPSKPVVVVAPAATPVAAAEYRTAHKWDACVENSLVKTGYGLLGGAALALLLFRAPVSRTAIAAFGGGIGAGISWVECKQTFANKNHCSHCSPQLSKFQLPKVEESAAKPAKH